ncbi:hypothetical protein ABKN59_006363 [Abortiporus biennis]
MLIWPIELSATRLEQTVHTFISKEELINSKNKQTVSHHMYTKFTREGSGKSICICPVVMRWVSWAQSSNHRSRHM